MKSIKIFLITVSTLLVFALLFGVYVWYSLQKYNSETQGFKDAQQEKPVESKQQVKIQNITEVSDDEMPAEEEVIEIRTADLSDSQQKALRAFGIEGDSLIITESMIACAEKAVGIERYEAILGGAAPSPLESMKLLPCMNQ